MGSIAIAAKALFHRLEHALERVEDTLSDGQLRTGVVTGNGGYTRPRRPWQATVALDGKSRGVFSSASFISAASRESPRTALSWRERLTSKSVENSTFVYAASSSSLPWVTRLTMLSLSRAVGHGQSVCPLILRNFAHKLHTLVEKSAYPVVYLVYALSDLLKVHKKTILSRLVIFRRPPHGRTAFSNHQVKHRHCRRRLHRRERSGHYARIVTAGYFKRFVFHLLKQHRSLRSGDRRSRLEGRSEQHGHPR